ncbi:Lethal(2) giant larvae sro7 [Kickxella alabastrina]|uniref:Lethal(2) giant larvae sro7 n=1 Tax=Kickxella alabastrina TaxID=61397 RepID=A0ACC1I9K0_9FUNG|nr:Lethal(2) giant larvae sro7 [Kickxella alabastrina]
MNNHSDIDTAGIPPLALVEDPLIDPTLDATAIAFDPVQGIMAIGYATGQISLHMSKRSSIKHAVSIGAITHLQFVPAQATLAAIDEQGVLRIFDTHTMRSCFDYNVPHMPTCMALIPGTAWLLVGTYSGRLYFVDAVGGRKSDFSIGCRTKHKSPVVSVEPHPVETEKILITYASGVCVICDLGRGPSAESEKDIVLSSYVFEHHPKGLGHDVQLAGAGWSPEGDMFATTYSNGVFCVFSTHSGSGVAPIVARTIAHADVLPNGSDAHVGIEDLDYNTHYLKHVRWCTHAHLDRSFLVVTSGPSVIDQRHVYVFSTLKTSSGRGAKIKSSSDISMIGQFDLKTSMSALCPIPAQSPWRNGNEDIRGLAVLVGFPAAVHALELAPDLQLRMTSRLPGDMKWCQNPAVSVVCEARGQLDSKIHRMLSSTLVHASQLLLEPMGTVSEDPSSANAVDKSSSKISQAMCTADSMGMLSLWCIRDSTLVRCDGVGADVAFVSQLLGIEGQVAAIDWYASSGLVVIAMDSGETLFYVLTGDPGLLLAHRYTPNAEICEQAATYYSQPLLSPRWGSKQGKSNGSDGGTGDTGASAVNRPIHGDPQQYVMDADAAPLMPTNTHIHHRPASLGEGSFFRRNSKRLSTSIGSVFRRSSAHDTLSNSENTASHGTNESMLRAGLRKLRSSVSENGPNGIGRRYPIDADAWKQCQRVTSAEMDRMVYGLHFSATEIKRVAFGRPGHLNPKHTHHRSRKDSGTQSLNNADVANVAEVQQVQQKNECPSCVLLPFMMARFYYRGIVDVVVSQDGIAGIAYKGGTVVVVDCVKQTVLLTDNVNQSPDPSHTVADVFSAPGTKDQHAHLHEAHQEITTMNISFAMLPSDSESDAHVDFAAGEYLFVGTSLGQVLQYSIGNVSAPPIVAARLELCNPVIYVSTVIGGHESQSQQLLIAASPSSIAVYAGSNSTPTATYDARKEHSRASLVAARAVKLESGWEGVAAINNRAIIVLLTLPSLDVAKEMPLSGARGLIKSALDVRISESGHILLTSPNGSLLQARITDRPSSLKIEAGSGSGKGIKSAFFDSGLHPPPQPARKGITSWLLGKSSNAAPDIDLFLSAHYRNLLINGGIKPSGGIPPKQPRNESHPERRESSGGQQSSVRDKIGAVDTDDFSGMKTMAERRGQQLDDLNESLQRTTLESQSFLNDIRAYNAKQEKKSKRMFGLL